MSYLSRTFLRRTGIRAFNLRRAIFTLHAFMLEKMGVFRLLHIMSILCRRVPTLFKSRFQANSTIS